MPIVYYLHTIYTHFIYIYILHNGLLERPNTGLMNKPKVMPDVAGVRKQEYPMTRNQK